MFSILFLISILSISVDGLTCHGEEVLDPSGKYCFAFSTNEKNFHESEKICHSYGGYNLAAVKNMIDNNFLWQLARNSGAFDNYYWIGGTDLSSDGSWQWVDGSPFDFANWAQDSSTNSGDCLAMRIHDGKWQPYPCDQQLPYFCYGNAPGSPTDAPIPGKTTQVPTRAEKVYYKWIADAESLGDPNTDMNARKYYENEREFIRTVADGLYDNPNNGINICTLDMNAVFYGFIQYEQLFDSGVPYRKNQFDSQLEDTTWDGKTDHFYNITDAINGVQQFRWTPKLEDFGYSVLIFMTARTNFDSTIPSLFSPKPLFDEIIVVQMNGAQMPLPPNPPSTTVINVSNNFNQYDVSTLQNLLKCH